MTEYEDLRNDPEFKAWAAHISEEVVPKLDASAVTISLAPSDNSPDIKYAVELGLSIMMDKPIVILCEPGQQIPAKLRRVADQVLEVDWRNDPESAQQVIGAYLDTVKGGASGE